MSESVTISLPTLSIIAQGSLVRISLKGAVPSPTTVISKRGQIAKFSSKSRKRLIDLMASFDLKNALKLSPAIFITLTYGQVFPDCETAKAHLEAFKKRLIRFAPNCSALWRLEFQERGAPHFHFVAFGLPYLEKAELARWWHEIVGDVYADNSVSPSRPPFTRIESINSAKRAFSYVSKYIAKVPVRSSLLSASPIFEGDALSVEAGDVEAGDGFQRGFNHVPYLDAGVSQPLWTGRFWGVVNRDKLPFAQAFEQFLVLSGVTLKAFFNFRRLMSRKWAGARSGSVYRQYSGASIYAWDGALQWFVAWSRCVGDALGDDF